jgi:hypothetical protein
MSIGTMTSRRLPKPSVVVEEVHVEFRSDIEDSGTLVWGQVNELLRTSLDRSGFPQPSIDLIQQGYRETERPSLIVVAPGIAVEVDEYEERYGSIDLEYFRTHMSPEMFKAYVRHIGSIKGRPELNIGEFVDTPEI